MKILVIEDDVLLAETLKALLAAKGFASGNAFYVTLPEL